MKIPLAYGQGSVEVAVAADLITHRGAPPLADEAGAVREALAHPIGTPPLGEIVRPGERVAIVVNDITRLTRTDLLLPPVVEELNRGGVPDGDIFIVFALGNHRGQTEEERRSLIGDDLFHRIRNFDHNSADENALVTLGTTRFGNTVQVNRHVMEADRIVLTGEIIYHQIAGYSGGRKSLVPGVAGARTITFNHSMIFDPRCGPGMLEGNPSHEDLLEGARMAEPDFILNIVLTPDGKVARVVAGHLEQAHREGCRTVDELLSANLDAPYDVLIASAGGYPLDIDLRQAHKGLENACRALQPGGSILYFAECPNGFGNKSFEAYVWRYRDESEMKEALLRNFEVGAHKAYWIARLARLYRIHLVSALPAEAVERCHMRPVAPERYAERLRELLGQAGPRARVGIIPHAGHTLPRVPVAQEAGR